MHAFAQLVEQLDAARGTGARVAALAGYFRQAGDADAAWALHLLRGGKVRSGVRAADLRRWVGAWTGWPEWLVTACHEQVGDTAETLALLLPQPGPGSDLPLHRFITEEVQGLQGCEVAEQARRLHALWSPLDRTQAFILGKLLTGAFRLGVAEGLVRRGLAEALGSEPEALAHRLAGDWKPSAAAFAALRRGEGAGRATPYPFLLAEPLSSEAVAEIAALLGAPEAWQAEWKWDGMRAQLIQRGGELSLWSRGGELLSPRFPEVLRAGAHLPQGTVLDGELLVWEQDRPLPFARLQRRLQRRSPSPAEQRAHPVVFLAYDLLELGGRDLRGLSLRARRPLLETLLHTLPPTGALRGAPPVAGATWEAWAARRAEARERGVEGLMLKRLEAPYGQGRVRGTWWKWKTAPYTADLVLIAAQPGHGRRAGLFTDYTLAARDDREADSPTPQAAPAPRQASLFPELEAPIEPTSTKARRREIGTGPRAWAAVAKAYSGLSAAEIEQLDAWIRAHTARRHGPVRGVEPHWVFEIAFEGIQESSRHASGLALRFPRIVRWRRDKSAAEADSLSQLRERLQG